MDVLAQWSGILFFMFLTSYSSISPFEKESPVLYLASDFLLFFFRKSCKVSLRIFCAIFVLAYKDISMFENLTNWKNRGPI